MEQVEDNKSAEGKGAHINLALELDENIPGYEKFADVPLKTPGVETKDVVDFPAPKPTYSETDDSNIGITNIIIFEDLPSENDPSGLGKILDKVQVLWETTESFVVKNKKQFRIGFYIILILLYVTYFIGAIYHYYKQKNLSDGYGDTCEKGTSAGECFWCHGLGFLVIITIIVTMYVIYSMVFKRVFNWFFTSTESGEKAIQRVLRPTMLIWEDFMNMKFASAILNGLVITVFLIFLIVDSSDDRRRLLSIFGLVVIVLFGAIFSKHPGRIRWRHVMWGLALQFIFGLLILRWSVGQNIFDCLGEKVSMVENLCEFKNRS